MSLAEEVDALKKIPLFANIELSKLKLLAFTSERLSFQPGEVICQQGEMGDAAYIIMEGEADVIVELDGELRTVTTLGKNDFVGEIAILCDVPRTATVKAKSAVTTLMITKELFFRMITEFPQMAVEVMRELALRLERTTKVAFANKK